MVKVKIDMTGWVMAEHGVPDSRWTVIEQTDDYIESNTGKRYARWLCECSCEKHTRSKIIGRNLRQGRSKSCGCLKAETSASNGRQTKKYNKVVLNLQDENGLYGIGYCSNTNSEFYFDMDDYDKIKDCCWNEHIIQTYHALEAKVPNERKNVRMHWLITGKNYDHIDRNPLNNRKYNLRVANSMENARNRTKQSNNKSGVIGVYFHKFKQKWIASINIYKKQKELGAFVNKDDAIKTRLQAEKEYYGEFAPQKHLFKEYGIE